MMIDIPPEPSTSQQQVIEQRLLDCGLDRREFTVTYEDYLQSIQIAIAPNSGASSENFACIKKAAGDEIVTFQDDAMSAAYTNFVSQLARPEMLAMMEARLNEAGLLEGLPDREDFGSLAEYAAALEVHVGIEPRSALHVSGDTIVFDPQNNPSDDEGADERYSNLFAVISYATTRDRLSFGFTGHAEMAD